MDELVNRLNRLEILIKGQSILKKNVLNFKEACVYLQLSQSHLYKLTSGDLIPHYKPNHKKIYFNRVELDKWLLRNRVETIDEIEQKAADYIIKKGKARG